MERQFKKIFSIIAICLMVFSVYLCTDAGTINAHAENVSYVILTKYAASMGIGEQFYLLGISTNGKKLTYSSSKSSIASVNKYGVITAKKAGKATITVKSGQARAYCFITVNRTAISLSKSSIILQKGQTTKLTAKTSSGTKVKFTCSNSSVVKIDTNGNIRALKNGKAVITVKADGEVLKCDVIVNKPVITLQSYNLSMKIGESLLLIPKVSNGYIPKYSSSNSKVVKVSTTGKLTAVKTGKAVITISEDGTKVKCTIQVVE